MKLRLLLVAVIFSVFSLNAQEKQEVNPVYRGEKEKINDLVHAKLKVGFDFSKQHLLGEAWITLKPHFYNVSELELDAKAMLIHQVASSDGKDLKYKYDGQKLIINFQAVKELENMFASL